MRAKRAEATKPQDGFSIRLFLAPLIFLWAAFLYWPGCFAQDLRGVEIGRLSDAKVSVKITSRPSEGGSNLQAATKKEQSPAGNSAKAIKSAHIPDSTTISAENAHAVQESKNVSDPKIGKISVGQISGGEPIEKEEKLVNNSKQIGKGAELKTDFEEENIQGKSDIGDMQISGPSADASSIPFFGLPEPSELGKAKSSEISYRNTSCFSLISKDAAALSEAVSFAKEVERIFSAAFGFEMRFVRPIVFQVFEADDDSLTGDFSVEYGSFGNVSISAKWKEDLPLEGFCRLLAGAMLSKIAYEYCGVSDDKMVNIPRWAYLGFARELENSIMQGGIYNDALAAKDMKADFISTMNLGDSDISDESVIMSFWTIKTIGEILGPSKFAGFFKATVGGESAENLKKMLPWNSRVSFDAWFACAFKGEIFARTGGILSPEDSREEIRYLCVPAFSDANGELAPIVDTAFLLAPSSRASDWALRANLRRIKAMLSVINPIYYDSLLQLGLMCETALEGDEDAFYKAREGFLRDFEAAMKLEKRVKSLLQKGI